MSLNLKGRALLFASALSLFSAGAGAVENDPDLERLLIQGSLADPDVLKVNDDLFFLSGTLPSSRQRELPIYESNDLRTFRLKKTYNPSSLDPQFDYCTLWAPDLSLQGDVYDLYFSATRVRKGQACPGTDQPTTFFARASGTDLHFSPAQPVRPNLSGPRSIFSPTCPSDGCRNAIRIDSAVVEDDDSRWLFYVWFENGNNISAFRMNDPFAIYDIAGPARFPTGAEEEAINEGPDIFRRDSKYYLFFSAGWYTRQYSMRYIMADSVEQLTRARGIRRYSHPVRDSRGHFVETHGHNSIVERHGEFYNFFHQSVFDANGKMTRRDTYRQRLQFREDGTIVSLNMVNLAWTSLPNHEYSVDIVTKSGEVIGPCIGASLLGRSSSATYTGICPSAGDRLIRKGDIAAFRLFWSNNGAWGPHNSREIPYDGSSDQLFWDLNGNTVDLNWTMLTNHEYSVDIVTRAGQVIGPCINSSINGKNTRATYSGFCPSAGNRAVPKSEIAAFRLFWSNNGVWGPHNSREFPYDGRSNQVFLKP